MKKLLALALSAACGATSAQTPAINPMPDGSRDMYAGLGVQSAPRYEGAGSHKTKALPVLQIEWSNGMFISGMSAGMHLSGTPGVEVGPLLSLQASRGESGLTSGAIGVGTVGDPTFGAGTAVKTMRASNNRLAGMGDIHARLLGGGFFNYYLSPGWRLTSSLLWGAGNDRTGGIAELGVQRLAIDLAPHHSMALSAGLSVANRNYNQAFFGVTPCQSAMSANPVYTPGGGAKDAHLSARWNWALSSSWMLSSNLQGERLLGSAKNSPLVERPTNVTVSTALAYRF